MVAASWVPCTVDPDTIGNAVFAGGPLAPVIVAVGAEVAVMVAAVLVAVTAISIVAPTSPGWSCRWSRSRR